MFFTPRSWFFQNPDRVISLPRSQGERFRIQIAAGSQRVRDLQRFRDSPCQDGSLPGGSVPPTGTLSRLDLPGSQRVRASPYGDGCA